MTGQTICNTPPATGTAGIPCTRPCTFCTAPDPARILGTISLCIVLLILPATAAEYVLNATTMGQFGDGIRYQGTDGLVLVIEENVTIRSTGTAGIASVSPITIRSPNGRTLAVAVDNDGQVLSGIEAPSVFIESGSIDIRVSGKNDPEKGNAFGFRAGSGNVTITGGSVTTSVATTGHKNKGIWASRYIVISGGSVITGQRGGMNTFGLDGGDVEGGHADGGVIISGGYIAVSSGGGGNRNLGIDSKSGTIRISGNPVIFIAEDGAGARQNWALNGNITTITGGHAVVFTSDGGDYTLREDAILAQNATLIPGRTFVIPAGRSLGISDGTCLIKPAGTTLVSGKGYGTFDYAGSIQGGDGGVTYAGREPVQHVPAPLAGLLAGLGAAVSVRAYLHGKRP